MGTVYKNMTGFSPIHKYKFIDNVWKPDALFNFFKTSETEGKL